MATKSPTVAEVVEAADKSIGDVVFPPLLENRLEIAEYSRAVFFATVGNDIPFNVVANDPQFFGNAVVRLGVGSRIEVMPENRSWWAEVVVLKIDRTRSLIWVGVIREPTRAQVNRDDFSRGATVERVGDSDIWRVVRGKKVLKTGFTSEADALLWASGSIVI